MRCISVWNPYATLIVRGFKKFETKPGPVPSTIMGERIGIASTKIEKPGQRAIFNNPKFCEYYKATGLPRFSKLNHGYLLGTVQIVSSVLITEDVLKDVGEEEQLYGWWRDGRYAWGLAEPEFFDEPIPVRGGQNIWTYKAA